MKQDGREREKGRKTHIVTNDISIIIHNHNHKRKDRQIIKLFGQVNLMLFLPEEEEEKQQKIFQRKRFLKGAFLFVEFFFWPLHKNYSFYLNIFFYNSSKVNLLLPIL